MISGVRKSSGFAALRTRGVGWLYGETEEGAHGLQPGTLAVLAMEREQKTREILAEMGISPESAAVSLKAAKRGFDEMPASEGGAIRGSSLFQSANCSEGTGKKALRELVADGVIHRAGTGSAGNAYRYFKRFKSIEERTSRLRGE